MLSLDLALSQAQAGSPYLSESITLFPVVVEEIREDGYEAALQRLWKCLPTSIGTLEDEMSLLRQLKRKTHLIIALADISAHWSWVEVTEYLTQLADLCLGRILYAAGQKAGIEGTFDNPVPGFFILAVGKYGARELNYSSDIDFNVFYDPDVIRLPRPDRAERTMIKLVQALIRGMEAVTADGYIFRTDLRLRPDPRSNAVAVSTLTAERYYEKLGQNWERAAMIKARVCAGDKHIGEAFIEQVLSPFIWRRSLDYAAIEDILAIKRQIHSLKTGLNIHVPGYHLKLGLGGIREIEFYAQVQQLILGGRHPELRTPRTVDALDVLAQKGFVETETVTALKTAYGKLRLWEHRAQMVKDEQTHIVPEEAEARESFAYFCGHKTLEGFEAAVAELLQGVHEHYVALFPEAETLSAEEGNLVFTGVEPDPETLRTLKKLGYENGPSVWQDMADWLGGRIRATRSERAREYLTALAPGIIRACSQTANADAAFLAFGRFLSGLNSGVVTLSMFRQEPERLSHLISMMSASPHVADMLASRPSTLDAMADPSFLEINLEELGETYVRTVAAQSDFEDALNSLRRQVKEDQFRVIAGLFSKTLNLSDAGLYFTKIADCAVKAALPVAVKSVVGEGAVTDYDVAVLALGKMGGAEMTLASDLDVMVLYRPREGQDIRHFTKITQRLINILSVQTAEGGLYEVDMALRPSGKKGPVAVALEAFSRYYEEQAWTWEFMALTRSRIVTATSGAFQNEVRSLVQDTQMLPRADLNKPNDIATMLSLVKREKPARTAWDVKNMDGGLRDIEFIAQACFLSSPDSFVSFGARKTADMLICAGGVGIMEQLHVQDLQKALSLYHYVAQATAMVRGGLSKTQSQSSFEQTAEFLSYDEAEDLMSALKQTAVSVSHIREHYITL